MNKYIPRLLDDYNTRVIKDLEKKLNISNVMRVPKLKKIVLNMGLGNAREDKNTFKQALNELSVITGQKAIGTKSKKAISNFKIREGDIVGAYVTLRRTKMYEFLDRFISVASPRIRDFRGLSSKGFDGRGNYNFGVTEQIVFPEINYDKVNSIRGMNICIVTSTNNDYEAYELLSTLGFPINEYKTKKELNKIKEEEANAYKANQPEGISEETPVEEVSKEETPAEEAAKEETPAEEAAKEETPAEEANLDATPEKEADIKDSSSEDDTSDLKEEN